MAKRLSAIAFDRASARLNIAPRPLAMARSVLVDGEAQAAVAKREGVSRNAVCLAVNRIWDASSEVPEGFERVTAILPKHKAFLVRQWQREAGDILDAKR
jgi:hypothetical protein